VLREHELSETLERIVRAQHELSRRNTLSVTALVVIRKRAYENGKIGAQPNSRTPHANHTHSLGQPARSVNLLLLERSPQSASVNAAVAVIVVLGVDRA